MKTTKMLLILMVILTVVGGMLFVGCSREEQVVEKVEEAPVTDIVFWNLSSRKSLSEQAIADFNTANSDVNVEYVLNGGDDHKTNLKIAASSKSLPTVWFNWGGTLGSFYPENGLSYDLSDYAAANNWDQKFVKTALDLSTFDGNLAGYPTSIAMIGMFYRKDIFDAAGLQEPTTFEEFENIMATLSSKGYIPLSVAGKKGWHIMRFVEALLEMRAGSEKHDQLKALQTSWDTEEVVWTFAKYKEYADKGYYPNGFVTLDPNDTKSLLYADQAVMAPEGPWMESNVFADEQDHNLYGYFKLPLSAKGNRMSGFVEMIQFNANLSDTELEAGMRFADYLYSPEAIGKYGPLIKQPVPRLDNTIPSQLTMTMEMIDDLAKYGSYTISDQGLPQEIVNKLFEAQDSVATGVMTPEEAAKFMQTSIEAYKASK